MKSLKYAAVASALLFALAPATFAQGVAADTNFGAQINVAPVATVKVNSVTDLRAEVKEERAVEMEKRQEEKREIKEDKNEIKTTVKENRKELEQKRDELKKQVADKRMQLVAKFATQMTRVHQAAIKRLTKLGDRIDSRIAKIEAGKKVSMADAKAKMVIARADIAAAQTYLDGIAAQVTVITSASTTPQVALKDVKDLFAKSRESLKTAQQALVDVISSIKVGIAVSATTTTP